MCVAVCLCACTSAKREKKKCVCERLNAFPFPPAGQDTCGEAEWMRSRQGRLQAVRPGLVVEEARTSLWAKGRVIDKGDWS